MQIEDLPFHEARIYIEGENSYSKPWTVSTEARAIIAKYLRSRGYHKINDVSTSDYLFNNEISMNHGEDILSQSV